MDDIVPLLASPRSGDRNGCGVACGPGGVAVAGIIVRAVVRPTTASAR
jgi:hypothetical protein